MKVAMLIIGLMITSMIKAQLHTIDSFSLYKRDYHLRLRQTNFYSLNNPVTSLSIDNSVLKIPPPILTYQSNENGFNIYQSSPDNMYIVKPDSTVAFSMPVKNISLQIEPVK